jgi:ligand-binding SRPBCC domain-containing protein
MSARGMRSLHRRQWLARPLDDVFAFFARPENLADITPPWLGFRIVTPGPLTMQSGLTIDYTVRVFGVRTRWRSLIAAYEPPRVFCDVQVIGPYRRWDHWHWFRSQDGGTLVEDLVFYEPPLGSLGALVDVLVIRRQLAEIFDYRQRRIAARFGVPATAHAS